MRLDFNVLWIDDQPSGVIGAIENLRFHVAEEGFMLRVKQVTNVEEALDLVRDHVLIDQIDLVLVDFDLGVGDGSGGETVLAAMKTAMPYKEVVFYSAVATADLRRHAFEEGVEGVYCANRMSLADTVKGVFDALVKKVLDIDHCRGIILGATSDIDYLVNDILRAIDAKLDDEQRAESIAQGLKMIDSNLDRSRKTRDKLAEAATMDAMLEQHQLFTSANRLQLLRVILKGLYEDEQPELGEMLKEYVNRIPQVRNMFGHVPLAAGDAHKALSNFGGATVDPDTLRDVRKELIRFRDHFLRLAELAGCIVERNESSSGDEA
jgi:CheY-like chemotaxis protein